MTDQTIVTGNCIVEKTHFGYSDYHNLCTGLVSKVPWTVGDWIGVGVIVITAVLLFMFASTARRRSVSLRSRR